MQIFIFRMRTLLIICLSILFFHTESPLIGQSWDWAYQLGADGNESAEDLVVAENGDLLVAGSFSETLMVGNQMIMAEGEEDVYLVRLDKNGVPIWGLSGGGEDVDETRAIGEDKEGNIYWTGTYWREISFGGEKLTNEVGVKAIFVVKYSSSGQLIWARSLSATGLKDIGDLDLDSEGNLYLTGYFGGELVLPDATLTSKGEADLFVAKINPEGQTTWATAIGESGFIRGINIIAGEKNDVFVSGYFKGQLIVSTDTIKTNTSDNDVFVARFDQSTGAPVWGQKAGGVHEDFCTGMTIDEFGNLYISGYYYGVISLGGGIEVQASGFNDNFYLLKYADTGEPLWAKTFGGEGLVHSIDLQYRDGELLLGGYFRDQLTLGTTNLTAEVDFDTFLATYSSDDGAFRQLWQLPSSGFMLLSKLSYLDANNHIVIGSFTQTASLTPLSLTSSGGFNAFVAKGTQIITSLSAPQSLRSPVNLYPNPASSHLYIQTPLRDYQITIFNALGQRLFSGEAETAIDLSMLPSGIYQLLIVHESGQRTLPFFKN